MKRILCLLVSAFAFVAINAQDDFKEYVGTYRFPDGSQIPTVEIKIDNGVLVASSPAGSSPLEKQAKDTFSIVNYNGMMYFQRNADHVVVGMKFEVEDLVQEGKKDGNNGAYKSYGSYKSDKSNESYKSVGQLVGESFKELSYQSIYWSQKKCRYLISVEKEMVLTKVP